MAQDNKAKKKKKPHVAVVCATFRNPDKPSRVREIGMPNLIHQMRNQDFDGKVSICILESSEKPSPFFEALGGALDDELIYMHVPSRNNIGDLRKKFPEATRFIPTDEDLETPFWRQRLAETEAWSEFLPFEDDYPIKVKIADQPRQDRPMIGMKKNAGIAAIAEKFGEPDYIIFADDDDHHGPDYIAKVVETLENADFTRMTHTYTHVFPNRHWGELEMPIKKDVNGNWRMEMKDRDRELSWNHPEGHIYKRNGKDFFNRVLFMAWPLIGHDGALHALRHDTWKKSVEKFGGMVPFSFSEDIVYHRMLKDHLGKDFNDQVTHVDAPSFIRSADCSNESVVYWMDDKAEEDMPQWARDSVKPVYDAIEDADYEYETAMRKLGEHYARKGTMDYTAAMTETPKGARNSKAGRRRDNDTGGTTGTFNDRADKPAHAKDTVSKRRRTGMQRKKRRNKTPKLG